MEIVRPSASADEGYLTLDVPESMRGQSLQVTLIVQDEELRNALGWSIGYKERLLGAFPTFPEDPESL